MSPHPYATLHLCVCLDLLGFRGACYCKNVEYIIRSFHEIHVNQNVTHDGSPPTTSDKCVLCFKWEYMSYSGALRLKGQFYIKSMQTAWNVFTGPKLKQRSVQHRWSVYVGVHILPCIEDYQFIMHARPLEKVCKLDFCCTYLLSY